MNNLPARKRIRLSEFDHANAGAYFITVCTAGREKIFWSAVGADTIRPQNVPLSAIGRIVELGIQQIPSHYETIVVDKYCIMPDHVHMIVRILGDANGRIISAPTIPTVIGSMKRWVSRQIGKSIWQKSFYDHGIRNQQDYDEIWKYIEYNPLKYLLSTES
jgi:REP element-mobilizing transposase RayT